MIGFHGGKSSFQHGDEVQECAEVCLQNLLLHAGVTTPLQKQPHRQHGGDLLTEGAAGQLGERRK